jgi:hypothetical protein
MTHDNTQPTTTDDDTDGLVIIRLTPKQHHWATHTTIPQLGLDLDTTPTDIIQHLINHAITNQPTHKPLDTTSHDTQTDNETSKR